MAKKDRIGLTPLGLWMAHQESCPTCMRVDVGHTHTLSECCFKGASMLKEALCFLALERLRDREREALH